MTTSLLDISKSTHLAYLRQTIDLAHQSPPKPTNFRVGCMIVSFPSPSPSTAHPTQPQLQPQLQLQLQGTVLSTGYTLELPGNTHAEQCALKKLAHRHPQPQPQPSQSQSPPPPPSLPTTTSPDPDIPYLPSSHNTILYTSLEPCSVRLSGNTACVRRILQTRGDGDGGGGIRKVVFGAKEPGTFVKDSQSCRILTDAGVEWEYIPDLEEEILRVAMEGHVTTDKEKTQSKDVRVGESGSGTRDGQSKQETRIDDITDEERKRQEAQPRNPKKRMFELNRETGG